MHILGTSARFSCRQGRLQIFFPVYRSLDAWCVPIDVFLLNVHYQGQYDNLCRRRLGGDGLIILTVWTGSNYAQDSKLLMERMPEFNAKEQNYFRELFLTENEGIRDLRLHGYYHDED